MKQIFAILRINESIAHWAFCSLHDDIRLLSLCLWFYYHYIINIGPDDICLPVGALLVTPLFYRLPFIYIAVLFHWHRWYGLNTLSEISYFTKPFVQFLKSMCSMFLELQRRRLIGFPHRHFYSWHGVRAVCRRDCQLMMNRLILLFKNPI